MVQAPACNISASANVRADGRVIDQVLGGKFLLSILLYIASKH